jgi:hypothetical protein
VVRGRPWPSVAVLVLDPGMAGRNREEERPIGRG